MATEYAQGGLVPQLPLDAIPAYLSGGCVLLPSTGKTFDYDTEAEGLAAAAEHPGIEPTD